MPDQTHDSDERRLGPINLNYGALNVRSNNGLSDLSATIRLFQNSTTISPGALSVGRNGDSYNINYSGGLPLNGSFGAVTTEGLRADNIAIGRSGLSNFSVSGTAIKIGEHFQLNNVNAQLRGERGNFRVTSAGATGTMMGQDFNVTNPSIVIDRNGNFVEATFGSINSGHFNATGGRMTSSGVELTSAGVDLPEIYGQTMHLSFANLNIGQNGVTGTGQVTQESELSLLNDTLTVSNFTGTANIENNGWNVNTQGTINYNNNGTTISATGSLTYGRDGVGSFQLTEGSVNSELNGIIFTSEGLEFDSTTDMLVMNTGTVSAPIFNGRAEGTLTNASFGSDGFDFDSVTLSSGMIDLFPGMQMSIGTATVTNNSGNYTFAMENGQVSYSSASMSGAGTISVWHDNQGFRGSIVGPTFTSNFLDVTGSGEIAFDENGLHISAAQLTVKNLGSAAGALTVNAEGIEYGSEGLVVNSLDVTLPPLGDLNARAHLDNLTVGEGGINAGGGIVQVDGDMTFAGGALKVDGFTSEVSVSDGGWNVSVNGNLGVTTPNVTAQGQVNMTYAAGQMPTMEVTEGQLSSEMAGINLTATGINFDSAAAFASIDDIDVQIAQLTESGASIQTTGSGFEFGGAEGFNFTEIGIETSGEIELLPGLTVPEFTGYLRKEGGQYSVEMLGSVNLNSPVLTGGASSITYNYNNGEQSFSIEGLNIDSSLFSFSTEMAEYTAGALTIENSNFQVKNLGELGNAATVSVGNIVWNSEGLSINTVDLGLPVSGENNITAHADSIAVSDAVTVQGGSISVSGDISLAEGGLTLSNISGTFEAMGGAWNIIATGDIATALPSTVASGTVTITVTNAGAEFSIASGQITATLPGLTISATDINFGSDNSTLEIGTTTVAAPEVAGGQLTATANGVSFGPNGFDFQSIQVNAEGTFELLPGFSVSGLSGTVTNNGGEYDVEMSGSATITSGVLSGGASSVIYRYTGGENSFEITGLNLDSNYFSINTEQAEYSNDILNIDGTSLEIKNLGPVGDAASVSVGNIQWGQEGLNINTLDVTLPQIGQVTATGHADSIQVNDSVTVQGGTVNVSGPLSFAGDALTVNNITGTFNIGDSGWDASVSGTLGVNVPNTTASGDLTVRFGSDGTEFDMQNGQIVSTLAGLTLTATGISVGSDTSTLTVDTATLEVPELSGGDLNATINQVSFGPDGFDFQSVQVSSTGEFELVPGFSVSGLSGTLTNEGGGEYGIDAEATGTFSTSALTGGASVHFTRSGGETRFEIQQLNLSSNLFDFNAESAVYENDTLTIASVDLNLKNLGAAGDGLQASATNIEYSAQGLSVEHLEADFPQIGAVDIRVIVDGLRIASGGGITGRGTIEVGAEFQLAGGAVTLSNVSGTVDFQDNDWGVSVSGGLSFNVPNVEGGGQVTISYSGSEGINVEIANGSLSANFPGVEMAGTGIGYNYAGDEFTVDTTTINMPSLGEGGVNTTVEGLSVKNGDIDFQAIIIEVNQTITIIDGLDATLESGELRKEGTTMTATIRMGVNVDDSRYGIGGSGSGSMSYNLSNGEFSGSLESLSLNTSVFDLSINGGVEISQEGFHIGSASLQFSEEFDTQELTNLIPQAGELGAMALNALKGVRVSATDIAYNAADGFSVGDWSLDFARIAFDVMGLNGVLDIANLSASLSGSKTFDLEDFGIPTSVGVDIPIVPGINATGRIGLGANITIGAGISAQGDHDSDVWLLRGGLDISGNIMAYLQLGVEADAVIASAGAALRASINAAFTAGAGIGMYITYDPATNSVALADQGLTFDYNLLAEIFTRLDLVLEYEALFGLIGGEEIIELDRWDIGSFHLNGESAADSLGELFSNLNNTAYLMIDGDRFDL